MNHRRENASTILYAALAIAAALTALLPFSAPLKRRFLGNHQLAPPSVASWIAIGLLPKMYGGKHEFWMSAEPVTDYLKADLRRAPFEIAHYWVNHSPGRAVRLDDARESAGRVGAITYVRIESSYGDEALTTIYRVHPANGHIEVRTMP